MHQSLSAVSWLVIQITRLGNSSVCFQHLLCLVQRAHTSYLKSLQSTQQTNTDLRFWPTVGCLVWALTQYEPLNPFLFLPLSLYSVTWVMRQSELLMSDQQISHFSNLAYASVQRDLVTHTIKPPCNWNLCEQNTTSHSEIIYLKCSYQHIVLSDGGSEEGYKQERRTEEVRRDRRRKLSPRTAGDLSWVFKSFLKEKRFVSAGDKAWEVVPPLEQGDKWLCQMTGMCSARNSLISFYLIFFK